jgi:hypothetical protein
VSTESVLTGYGQISLSIAFPNLFKASTYPSFYGEGNILLTPIVLFCVADGYAFSQDENGALSQSDLVRSYDTTTNDAVRRSAE